MHHAVIRDHHHPARFKLRHPVFRRLAQIPRRAPQIQISLHLQPRPRSKARRLRLIPIPPVLMTQRSAKIRNHPLLAVNVPAIIARPAIEHQRANFLRTRSAIPRINLLIRRLHPPRPRIHPRINLIGLRNIHRHIAHGQRNRLHEVLVRAEMKTPVGKGRIHARLTRDRIQVCAMAICMERNPVALLRPQQRQHVGQIFHPVPALIAGILRLIVPRRRPRHQDLVLFVAAQPVDGIAAAAIALHIARRSDHLCAQRRTRRLRPILLRRHVIRRPHRA